MAVRRRRWRRSASTTAPCVTALPPSPSRSPFSSLSPSPSLLSLVATGAPLAVAPQPLLSFGPAAHGAQRCHWSVFASNVPRTRDTHTRGTVRRAGSGHDGAETGCAPSVLGVAAADASERHSSGGDRFAIGNTGGAGVPAVPAKRGEESLPPPQYQLQQRRQGRQERDRERSQRGQHMPHAGRAIAQSSMTAASSESSAPPSESRLSQADSSQSSSSSSSSSHSLPPRSPPQGRQQQARPSKSRRSQNRRTGSGLNRFTGIGVGFGTFAAGIGFGLCYGQGLGVGIGPWFGDPRLPMLRGTVTFGPCAGMFIGFGVGAGHAFGLDFGDERIDWMEVVYGSGSWGVERVRRGRRGERSRWFRGCLRRLLRVSPAPAPASAPAPES